MSVTCEQEVKQGKRFQFGENWKYFLLVLNEERIQEAEKSLKQMLGVEDLRDKSFLDIGSGSGLFSCCARRLGAKVHSFDYDPQSVACTQELKQRYFPEDSNWIVEEASVLDGFFLKSLGQFDIVYSWGVLHHTGSMWTALENAAIPVAPGGFLWISIYNYQDFFTAYWIFIKQLYNKLPPSGKWLMSVGYYFFISALLFCSDIMHRKDPRDRHRGLNSRGMSVYRDVVDWLGGWPFEVAKPEEIFRFYRDAGFVLVELKTCGGKSGCNEYLFRKASI